MPKGARPPATSITCVSPACDVTVGGCLLGPLPPERKAGWQDVAAEPGALPPRAPESDQGDVVVAAVWPVCPVQDDLLHRQLFLELLGHQSVIIPEPDGVAPRAVPVPAWQSASQRRDAGSWGP